MVYFPFEKASHFEIELKWLYRSWIEMQKHEPVMWRTDLIVFIENNKNFFRNSASFLNELNCSFAHKRVSDLDKPLCILIDYVALGNRKLAKPGNQFNKKDKYDFLLNKVDIFSDDEVNLLPFYAALQESLSSYAPLDSIMIAFDGYKYLKTAGYDYVMRTDMDVFLTPLFGRWLPDNCNDFYVGGGGYSADFNVNRLRRIAKDLQLEYAGVSNLGKFINFQYFELF